MKSMYCCCCCWAMSPSLPMSAICLWMVSLELAEGMPYPRRQFVHATRYANCFSVLRMYPLWLWLTATCRLWYIYNDVILLSTERAARWSRWGWEQEKLQFWLSSTERKTQGCHSSKFFLFFENFHLRRHPQHLLFLQFLIKKPLPAWCFLRDRP
jgi:hypothetical protein